MKKLPIGIQDFKKIIKEDYLYIDKTKLIHRVLTSGAVYFLSRPRRFGKSLTLSTIKEIYSGNKDLFKGLWIENNWDWEQTNPVIHLSFNEISYKEEGLVSALTNELREIGEQFNVTLDGEHSGVLFRDLITKVSEKHGKVVVLIDEYDKPLIDYLDDLEQGHKHREILKSFYGILKPSDSKLKLLLITGVSKFSQVSIFSDLNHVDDITLNYQYSTLTGITQEELETNFGELIQKTADFQEIPSAELLKKMKEWYNGYSWDTRKYVYNPFSILKFFANRKFSNFWYATGTPTFLIKLLRKRNFYKFEDLRGPSHYFETYTIDNLQTVALLFQTGYLTLKSEDDQGIFKLDFPNKEVKDSMLINLIDSFTYDENQYFAVPAVLQLRSAFETNNLESVIKVVNSLFKSIPSQIFLKKPEAYYHSLVYLMFNYLGQYVEAEVNTSDGRIDAVVKTKSHIYILEFKVDETKEVALQQIHDKNYADKYQNEAKTIVGIGINFSSEAKGVEDWTFENI